MRKCKAVDLQSYMAGINAGSIDDFKLYLLRRNGGDERDFPYARFVGDRKAVCRRCHLVMVDREISTHTGEFLHAAKPHQTRALRCPNDLKSFTTEDKEVEPFLRKARRRYLKRAGIRS